LVSVESKLASAFTVIVFITSVGITKSSTGTLSLHGSVANPDHAVWAVGISKQSASAVRLKVIASSARFAASP
jgi:hypothetical protein